MSLGEHELTHLLALARLSASESDRERLTRDVGEILTFVTRLLAADLDAAALDPMTHADDAAGRLRADEARGHPFEPDPLALAPELREDHVVVPGVLDRDAP